VKRLLAWAAVAAVLWPAASAAAAPGQLTVYLGALPDGSPVPAGPWTGLNLGTNAGGTFGVQIPDGVGAGWSTTATLAPPAGLTFASVTAHYEYWAPVMAAVDQPGFVTTFNGGVGWPYQSVGCAGHEWDPCYVGASGSGSATATSPSALSLVAQCGAFAGSDPSPHCTGGAHWSATRMTAVMGDAAAPVASAGSGTPLLSGSWQTAPTQRLDLTASDVGSGVYRAFWREGATTSYVRVDPASTTCRDVVSGGSDYEFAATTGSLVPCPTASRSYTPSFDLAAVGDGVHTVTFGVEDAAGRETIVASGRTVRINAPGGALADPGTPCPNGTVDASGTCVTRAPSVTRLPTLAGTPAEGGALATDDGEWDDVSGATFAYAWELCDAAGDACTPIPGQASPTLSLTSAMVDRTVRSAVTATTSAGTTTARSAPSWPIGRTASGVGSSGTGLRDVVAAEATAGGSGGRGRITIADDDALPVPQTVYVTEPNGIGADGTARIDAWRDDGALISGRLTTASGRPIAEAQVDVIVHTAVAGAKGRIAGAVTTDDDGAFRYRPQPGVSRIFTFGYRASLADTSYVHHASVAMPVAASVSLTADRTRLRNGQVLTLRGAVALAPAAARQPVDIQTRTPRGWKTIARTRLRSGRFAYQHRFVRTTRPTTYRFRALVAASSDWPLQRGTSPETAVHVLPGGAR
jgi:hypothetical protein